jgi:transcriptional regulator with XRE-family HTH domain
MNQPARPSPDTAAFLRALGKRIRLLRLTAELTQDELAGKAGMSRSFVSLIEHGTHGIDVARLARLAAALDLPLSTLIREAELRAGHGEHR